MTRAQIAAELRHAARLGWQWDRLSNRAYYAAAGLTHWQDKVKAKAETNRVFFLLVACALEGEL